MIYIPIFGNNLFSNSKPEQVITLCLFYFCLCFGFFFLPECEKTWYGVNCSQRCAGHCRDNDTCNRVTGQCDKGCDAGWTGYPCNRGKILILREIHLKQRG